MLKEKNKHSQNESGKTSGDDIKLEEEFDIEYEHLEKAFEDFVKSEKPKQQNRGLVNFATVTGVIMLVVVLFAFLQLIGLNVGPDFSALMAVMPFIGGLLVVILGFGWFRHSRRKKKRNKIHATDFPEFKLNRRKYTNSKGFQAGKSTSSGTSTGAQFDAYAYRKRKGFYRSRHNSVFFGVCGGLANYFGVDPTLVRIVTALSLLFYGSTLIIYLILAVAVKKEPLLPEFE